MKFLHIADLHLGKRLNDFSLIDDQKYILKEILGVATDKKCDAVILAGDIYDKPIPPAEAVSMLDTFLTELTKLGIKVFVVSGNHDSPERLEFASRLLGSVGVHIASVYKPQEPIVVRDDFGEVKVHLLPFVKPSHIRHTIENADPATTAQAIEIAVSAMNIDKSERNLLVAHQFVANGETEEFVGDTDLVPAKILEGFDYVALGHLHQNHSAGCENTVYSGSPLKYGLAEIPHQKGVLIVQMLEKGRVEVEKVHLAPLRDLREIKGKFLEITDIQSYKNENTDDYVSIILTDEEEIPNAIGRLRAIYPNIVRLIYDNSRTRENKELLPLETDEKSPLELVAEFFFNQNNQELSKEQLELVKSLIKEEE